MTFEICHLSRIILKFFEKISRLMSGRYRKTLMQTTAVLGAIYAIFMVSVIIIAKSEDAEARKFADGKMLGILLDQIGRATVNIWVGNDLRGRGYLDTTSKLLITNFHVMKIICNEDHFSPIDSLNCRQVRTTLRQEAQHLSGMPALLKVKSCSSWLDACALDVEPESPFGEGEKRLPSQRSSNRLILLPRSVDRGSSMESVIAGNALTSNRVLVTSNLASRPGYSGSPVFTESGTFVGILKAANWSSGINLSYFLNHIGMPSFLMMRRRTIFISENALQNVLFCHKDQITACSLLELKTLTNLLVNTFLEEEMDWSSSADIIDIMKIFGTNFTEEYIDFIGTSPISREMLDLSAAPEETLYDRLSKNGWLKDRDRLQEFASLLTAKSSLQRDDDKRDIAILKWLKSNASVDTRFIDKLIELHNSFIWGFKTAVGLSRQQ